VSELAEHGKRKNWNYLWISRGRLPAKPVGGDIAVNGSSIIFEAVPYKIFGFLVDLK
jgi:hypothetical protein